MTTKTKGSISPFQNFFCYLGGSVVQTIGDNPVTSYRQLVQQYAKNNYGITVSPAEAVREANTVFKRSPISAMLSGLTPRIVGVLLKRVPKFGILLGYSAISSKSSDPGIIAATVASILSAPFINPIRMIEKQQRVNLNKTGKEKPILEILRECKEKQFKPLFRGTVPLMGHSFVSAILGIVGQPKLQKYIEKQLDMHTKFGSFTTNLIASSIVSPIYVITTNPLSRLEVIMQTSSIMGKKIGVIAACKELKADMLKFGMRGVFRGQGIGIAKAIISLTLFHEARLFLTEKVKQYNESI